MARAPRKHYGHVSFGDGSTQAFGQSQLFHLDPGETLVRFVWAVSMLDVVGYAANRYPLSPVAYGLAVQPLAAPAPPAPYAGIPDFPWYWWEEPVGERVDFAIPEAFVQTWYPHRADSRRESEGERKAGNTQALVWLSWGATNDFTGPFVFGEISWAAVILLPA